MSYLSFTTDDPVILELIFREHLLTEPGLTQFEIRNENGTRQMKIIGPSESAASLKDEAPQSGAGT